jgi:hypothetical protein
LCFAAYDFSKSGLEPSLADAWKFSTVEAEENKSLFLSNGYSGFLIKKPIAAIAIQSKKTNKVNFRKCMDKR